MGGEGYSTMCVHIKTILVFDVEATHGADDVWDIQDAAQPPLEEVQPDADREFAWERVRHGARRSCGKPVVDINAHGAALLDWWISAPL